MLISNTTMSNNHSAPKVPVGERQSGNDQSDKLAGRALRVRIRQQELLAELGVLALQAQLR
jgi:hypothetical protein